MDKARCKAMVYPAGMQFPRPRKCEKAAKKDGYCGIHHPDAAAARAEASRKRQEERLKQSPYYMLQKQDERVQALEAENAALKAQMPKWSPVSEAPEKHGVCAVWIEADSPPRAFHGHGYYDGSDGWKMVQAADEYRSDNPAFEDYGMHVVFYVRNDELTPPTDSNLLSQQGNLERAKR